jgi:predicted CxxxxCH...CXXCH cytochrome family protein
LPVVTFPGYVPSHRNALNQAAACSICHDYTQGRTPPDPAAPSCFSASFANAEHASVACHASGPGVANHPVQNYLDPDHLGVDTVGFNVNCANCHAVSGTSPIASAPACQVCHTAGSPVLPGGSFGNCSSCHGSSSFTPFPDAQPNGTTYPNIAGAHAKHLALGFIPGGSNAIDCDTCHSGLGFVTLEHYIRANARPGLNALRVPPGDLSFLATYNAKTGASSFDNGALTCSNVSCHGGQANLNWQTETLDVNTQCASCHAFGTTQFNSFNSGAHNQGSHVALGCLVCHNTTTLAVNHFTALSTPAMEGPASPTIGGAGTDVITYVPGGIPGTGSCTPTCHGTRTW